MTTLLEVTEALERVDKELEKYIPELEVEETKYYNKYNRLLLSSQYKTASDREADARTQLEQEGLTEALAQLRGRTRMLLTRKEILIEISRNMRYKPMKGGEITKSDLPF